MFTGIVTERGTVRRVRRDGLVELEIVAPRTAAELRVGDSVAVNGVCLTATRVRRRRFRAQAMPETLARTTLGELRSGRTVNLELATRLGDRVGGHLVQGHVDGVGEVASVVDEAASQRVRVRAEPALLRYIAPKGSVTLEGVSLTVTEVGEDFFEVALIPHTLSVTTFRRAAVGDRLNVEVDVVARYVERLVHSPNMGDK